MSFGEFFDFFWCQRGEQFPGELAQERVSQSIDSFKMFEEQNEPFEMRRFEFAVHAVERMSDRVGDLAALQIPLERKNVVPDNNDVVVLLFGNAPDQNMNLAGI